MKTLTSDKITQSHSWVSTKYENDFCRIILLAFIIFMMNNKWPTQGSKSLYFYQELTFNTEILTKIPRKPNILMTVCLRLIANWIEIIIFKNSSAFLLCIMNRLRINNAACGGSVLRRVFSNRNDKTFPSSLNNLLYSHQQFLPEPTATSHASSQLHVLHQASSFIKKLIIMTLARMIEHRREFIAYLSQDILSFIFSTTLLNIAGAYHSV